MAKRRTGRAKKKAGLAPGSLVYVGEKSLEKTEISVIEYSSSHLEQKVSVSPTDLKPPAQGGVVWINVVGLNDIETIKKIGELFGIHDLVLEDILNTNHRPHRSYKLHDR